MSRVVAVCSAGSSSKLNEVLLEPIINEQGYISPNVDESAKGFVFAIYDELQKLQYIGFSKDLRSSLRTLFGRRPDKAWYYRVACLPTLDQQAMIKLREQWFEEVGGAPKGNKLALERNQWQQPVDAGAISERGKQGAAESTAKALLEIIKNRGCVEEFVPVPELLADGQVDFQQISSISKEEAAKQRSDAAAAEKLMYQGIAIVDGARKKFFINMVATHPTNGGAMCDVVVQCDNRASTHRVIVGREYYEQYSITIEKVLEACFALLLGVKETRHTEGILGSNQFPVNYFSVSSLEQWYPDEFHEEFMRATGVSRRFDELKVWRFNKVKDYGFTRGEKALGIQDGTTNFAEV